MSYTKDGPLEKGKVKVGIVDFDCSTMRLAWDSKGRPEGDPQDHQSASDATVHLLRSELFSGAPKS